ncbi:para-aminobenzoate N-oxygenase AurF [Nocardiopsis sp. Huas11]|uniref:diiron oxygenase n=1 Tax=Nocardiopsis sp. Huas11 TaxID=2183912 RepID=UPI000EB4A18D|nr:diiron oxygenase [Nocardiopsis sp. Huas11]RKS08422.1 para-aminobenzoate N-oxygenase AurF [Nocardiopsis sp. Huas11]
MTAEPHEHEVDRSTLRRLIDTWPTRAAVHGDHYRIEHGHPEFDPDVPDYPLDLVPFAGHPRFLAAPPEARQMALTHLWIAYNERVIATERDIAEPAFRLITNGTFVGGQTGDVRQAVHQALVDESFHTYMHLLAISQAKNLRGIADGGGPPELITRLRLDQAMAEMPERWERDLAVLVWGAVAETCINALLALIARDTSVQPMHSHITTLHLRDESAHGSLVVEVMRTLFHQMTTEQKRALPRILPMALNAFSEQDQSTLEYALTSAGVPGAEVILRDLRGEPASARLVRDYSGARRLVRELGLQEEVDFDFPAAPEWSPVGEPSQDTA